MLIIGENLKERPQLEIGTHSGDFPFMLDHIAVFRLATR